MQIENIQTKVGGVWKGADLSHVNVGGVWKNATVYVKVAGTWITQSLTPKVGDFVYSDKTWSSSYNSAKTCVGIVFSCVGATCCIVFLKDSVKPQTGNYQDLTGSGISQYVAMWGTAETLNNSFPCYETAESAMTDMDGYTHLMHLIYNGKINVNNYNPIWDNLAHYPAYTFCFLANALIGDSRIVGWLPSCGEMNKIGRNITLINKNILTAGGEAIKGLYSTSSQCNVDYMWAYNMLDNSAMEWPKEEALGARAVTSFTN